MGNASVLSLYGHPQPTTQHPTTVQMQYIFLLYNSEKTKNTKNSTIILMLLIVYI